MNIIKKLKDNLIIITPDSIKDIILINNQELFNIKYMNLTELKDNLFYQYHNHTLYYLTNKYHLLPENALIIMNNLYYINDYYHYGKLDYLYNIKQDLKNNNYLIINHLFYEYLKTRKVIIYGYPKNEELRKIISIMEEYTDVEIITESSTERIFNVHEYQTIEDETAGIAEQISILISKGIDINNIYIYKPTDEYNSTINRIFKIFSIPILLNNKTSLTNFSMVKDFLNSLDNSNIKDSNKVLDILIKDYPLSTDFNNQVYNTIIKLLNKYYDLDISLIELKDLLTYELRNSYLKNNEYLNTVKEVNIFEQIFDNDEYVFIMGINQDLLPRIFTDNDYLSDKEKQYLNIDTSKNLTILDRQSFIDKIKQIPNCILSYKLESYNQMYLPSNILEDNNLFNITNYTYQFTNNNYNNYLLADNYDLYLKYNSISPILRQLNNKTKGFNYNTYNNQYQTIAFDLLKRFLDNKIILSYSSIDTFYKCQFAFYLKHILKIKKPILNERSINIGLLFHKVLCEVYKSSFNNIEGIIDEYLPQYFSNSNKDKFFMNKYKKALIKTIDLLKTRETSFNTSYLEQSFYINKESKLNISIMGVIDKVLTINLDDNTYVIVIDYKTGQADIDLNKVIYGLDMQLLMYLYLLKNSKLINNYHFAGAYINPIMPGLINNVKDKTYQELFNDYIKLDGYTINDDKIVALIDHNYLTSSYIRSLRVKKDGTFWSTSKVYDSNIINRLLEIVENNIENCIHTIENTDFKINPKRIGMEKINDITGCRYCEYYDICYHKPNDIVNLKEYKKLAFLGGDEHDLD